MAKTPKTPPADEPDDDEEISPKLLEIINSTVTAAVTSHVGRKLKPLEGMITTLGESLNEKLEAMAAGKTATPPDPSAGKGGTAAPDPEVIAMRKRVQAMEDERKLERQQARDGRRDTRLTELAAAAGVDKNRMRGAVAVLREQVQYDDKDQPFIKAQRKGYEEDLELEKGVTEFFETDEGKSYLAPVGANGKPPITQRGSSAATVIRGNGAAGAGGGRGNAPTVDPKAAKIEKKEQALKTLQEGIGALVGGGAIDL